jgi:hypothetical protein
MVHVKVQLWANDMGLNIIVLTTLSSALFEMRGKVVSCHRTFIISFSFIILFETFSWSWCQQKGRVLTLSEHPGDTQILMQD